MQNQLKANTAEQIKKQYPKIPNAGVGIQRLGSKILPIRDFNNWAKSTIIQLAKQILKDSHVNQRDLEGISVLDLCCGKGGDLPKYFELNFVDEYTGIDITLESLVEATSRFNEMMLQRSRNNQRVFSADFALADVCSIPIPQHIIKHFDLVSCMFAMNYVFETRDKASLFFQNLRQLMASDGCFIAIFPSKEEVCMRLKKAGYLDVTQIPPVVQNDVYRIEFQQPTDIEQNQYGQIYRFDLEEAVQNTPEFLVDVRDFGQLCEENSLEIVHHFTSLESLLQDERIPEESKQQFSKRMWKTASTLNVKQITDVSQIGDEYLQVIKLYQAVIVRHKNVLINKRKRTNRIPEVVRFEDIKVLKTLNEQQTLVLQKCEDVLQKCQKLNLQDSKANVEKQLDCICSSVQHAMEAVDQCEDRNGGQK